MDLSIVIVSYNSEKFLPGLLTSIQKSKDNLKKEVIVVDNASSDNSLKVARKNPTKPTVIDARVNQGFSKSVNLGVKQSKGDYIMLLNPDTRVIGSCLKILHDFAKNTPSLGAVAPRLVDLDGKPQASVYKFPTILNAIKKDFLGCKQCFGKYLPNNRTQVVEVAVMAAFLLPRSVYEKVGGLDERFFLYYEDVEYCRRLKKFDLPVYYLPQAKIKHAHGASGYFKEHLQSPLLQSSKIYYGQFYSQILNSVLWLGHKWQVILRRKRFRD